MESMANSLLSFNLNPVFSRLERLAPSVECPFAPDEAIFQQDGEAEDILRLSEGTVCLTKRRPNHRDQIVEFAGAGSVLASSPSNKGLLSAYALDGVLIRRYPKTAFLEVVRSSPRFMELYVQHAQTKLQSARDHVVLLAAGTPDQKLMSFFVEWRTRSESQEIVLPMKRGDIANYLALSVETVSRTIRKLEREKVIAVDRNRVEILDLDRAMVLTASAARRQQPIDSAAPDKSRSAKRFVVNVFTAMHGALPLVTLLA
jgi:CRP/FNR family transcriptional regulator